MGKVANKVTNLERVRAEVSNQIRTMVPLRKAALLLSLIVSPILGIGRWFFKADEETLIVVTLAVLVGIAVNMASSLLVPSKGANKQNPWMLTLLLGIAIACASYPVLAKLRPELTGLEVRGVPTNIAFVFNTRQVEGKVYVVLVGQAAVFPGRAEESEQGGGQWQARIQIGRANLDCDFLFELRVLDVELGGPVNDMEKIINEMDLAKGVRMRAAKQ